MRKTLCRVDEVPEGGATSREVESATGGFSLVLTRVAGTVRAFHNECPHAGRRLDWAPGRFLVESGTLVCAAHGAQFMLDSGACIGGPCRGAGLKPVAISVEGDEVVLG
ncbi:MAG TPA: Rieske 2Fe-2S domain-containing protein [Xanthomonadales bacterium]|nr:Rieske 2Fe-2S domain-containing protein [Xanthomonadales bacterium]